MLAVLPWPVGAGRHACHVFEHHDAGHLRGDEANDVQKDASAPSFVVEALAEALLAEGLAGEARQQHVVLGQIIARKRGGVGEEVQMGGS